MVHLSSKVFKRCGVFLSVLLLLICCTLPAMAADEGSSTAVLHQSLLPFETLELSSSSGKVVLPWLGNSFYYGSPISGSSASVGEFTYSSSGSWNGSIASVSFDPSWAMNSYTHIWHFEEVVLPAYLFGSSTYSLTLSGSRTGDLSIYFDYTVIHEDSGYYRPSTVPVSTSSSGSVFDISGMISRALAAASLSTDSTILIENFTMQLSNVSAPGTFSISTNVYQQSDFPGVNTWFAGFDLPATVISPADPGAFGLSWLVSSVSGFMSTELWPEFTIGGLLRTIFIIGLIFWFLKLTF